MRIALVVTLAACSSEPLPVQTGAVTDPISCTASVDDYCSTHDCAMTVDEARSDSSLCPRVEMSCNGYVAFHSLLIDGDSDWWYANGVLVAFEPATIAGQTCAAGPPTFERPRCDFSLAINAEACH